jgi:hypothetical protein
MSFGHEANAAIILLGDFRSISASAVVDTQNDILHKASPGNFSDYDDLVEASVSLSTGLANAIAQQTSQIAATSVLASGEATTSAEVLIPPDPTPTSFATAGARTDFRFLFELTTPYLFDLSGIVSSMSLGGSSNDGAQVSLISATNAKGIFQLSVSDGETTPFDLSGTLLPGMYDLYADAWNHVLDFGVDASSGSSNFSLDMQFTAVPIPASLLLFGSGLIGLVGMTRRKKVA